jgi:steroid delta-isomerase-like uncharacterized protein
MDELMDVERRLVEEVFNEGKIAAIGEIHTDDYVGHWFLPKGGEADVADLKAFVTEVHEGFEDYRMETEFMFAADDRVVTGFRNSGTHTGEFMGIPATEKYGETPGIMVHRYEGDKIAEGWAIWDTMGMFQQLGVVPEEFHLTDFLETALNLTKNDVIRMTGRQKK